jgi:mono/diheme cytochrome c family protein
VAMGSARVGTVKNVPAANDESQTRMHSGCTMIPTGATTVRPGPRSAMPASEWRRLPRQVILVRHCSRELAITMRMSTSFRLEAVALVLAGTLAACEKREARAADPYAARMAQTLAPYDRAAHATRAAPTSALADSAPPQFTAGQAARGAEVYKGTCARCHAMTQWQGGTFAAAWQDRRLSDFYDLVSTTMPQDNPGGLMQQQYVDVTAYVLQLAGFASSDVALSPDTTMLRHARLTIKTAPDTSIKR